MVGCRLALKTVCGKENKVSRSLPCEDAGVQARRHFLKDSSLTSGGTKAFPSLPYVVFKYSASVKNLTAPKTHRKLLEVSKD
jgi:hypothetical protein